MKPSVAQSIVKVLGANKHEDGCDYTLLDDIINNGKAPATKRDLE